MAAKRKDSNTAFAPKDLVEAFLKQEGSYPWKVENFTELDESRVYSPEFEVGGYSWSVLLFPKGNRARGSDIHISAYLNFPEATYTNRRMCPTAKFTLIVVNSTNSGNTVKRRTTRTFNSQVKSSGFTKFLSLQEVLNPEAGCLVNTVSTLRLNFIIQANDNLGLISRAKTGFLGIKSPEETTLLTSFLQCLFHIKSVRKAVFQMPTMGSDDPQKSLPLALQHLFDKLQYQNTSVETKDLMKALDWDCDDVRLQYDVHELGQLLFGKLSKDIEACGTKDWISELVLGEYSNYTQPPSMEDQPISKQSYMGIPLDVLECKDIYASLEKFCQIDRLRKDNHHHMTSHRRGDSEQFALFDSFPTVLFFHLKRCYYNPDRRAILKRNQYWEFYDELDLEYNDGTLLSKNVDRTTENKYKLHSVLAHRSGPGGGGYCAFIQHNEKWFNFDGEVVKAVSAEEAIHAQFGDQNGTASANFSKGFESINKSAAVMLVYIRKSEWEQVMCNAGRQDLPKQIVVSLDTNQMEVEERRKKEEAHFYVKIILATEFHFFEQMGRTYYADLADFDAVKHYHIHKKTPFEDFKEMVRKDFGIPKHLQRFWRWSPRTNNTIRVSKPVRQGGIELNTVLDLRRFRDRCSSPNQEQTALMTIKLFLESPEGTTLNEAIPGNTLHSIQRNEILIFLKLYDAKSKKLFYLGHIFIQKTRPFCLVFEKAKRMAGIAPDENVIGFEEVKHLPEVICSVVAPRATPESRGIIQGDIIIIQKRPSLREIATTAVKGLPKLRKVDKMMRHKRSQQSTVNT